MWPAGMVPVLGLAFALLLTFPACGEDFRTALLGGCMNAEGCFCDDKCHALNDCCTAVKGTPPALPREEVALSSECMSVENIFLEDTIMPGGKYVSAIAQCPDKAISEEIRSGCEEANLMLIVNREDDVLQWLRTHLPSVVPVVSFLDRRLYANMYCAKCNGLLRDQVHFSPVYLGCKEENNETECLVSVKLPKGFARPCAPLSFRRLSVDMHFFSMDDLFIIPDEYLNNPYITLPLDFYKVDSNATLNSSVSTNPDKDSDEANEAYIWLQIALLVLSIIGLITVLVVYSVNAGLRRSLAGMLTMGLGMALLTMEMTFLLIAFAVPQVGNREFCVTMAALLLYSLLCSFAWMTLFAVQLLATFGNCKNCVIICWNALTCQWDKATSRSSHIRGYRHSSPRKRFRKYLSIAIILPFCSVIPAVAINESAFRFLTSFPEEARTGAEMTTLNITQVEVLGRSLAVVYPGFCPEGSRAWFTNLGGLVIWFLIPAGSMITFNSLALLIVCVEICRLAKEAQTSSPSQNEYERKRREKSKNLAGVCAKLAIILGASWFVQVFAGWWSQLLVMRRLLGLINSAQGGVIALSMLVSVKARRALANLLPECCRRFVAPVSSTQQSTSRDKDRSSWVTSKTWTSVLLPKRNRPAPQGDGDSRS